MLFSRVFCYLNLKKFTFVPFIYRLTKMISISPREHPVDLKPPDAVRHMKILDKDLFTKTITVPFLTTQPHNVSKIIHQVKKYLLKLEHFRPIHEEGTFTSIILNPIQISSFADINKADRKIMSQHGITDDNFSHKQIELTFDNYSVEAIFHSVLPGDKEGMASFTKVGHIVHVNLRDHLLPYKQIIGHVLVSKVAACKTVVNKINIIDNTYRNFKMEVLAGEANFMVTLKENRCIFEFDFSIVYWNSRLCTEHERIVNIVKKDEVFFDVFAGVGPFSVPVAKKGGIVWANDLNPESYKWLKHNAKKNKVAERMKIFNKDGKDFILEDMKQELIECVKGGKIAHITMNLPALASEFLKYFQGFYTEDDFHGVDEFKTPNIYLYCFAKGEDTEAITIKLINDSMDRDMTKYIKELFKVRTVSNFKEMMRVKIALEKDILLGKYENRIDSIDKRKGECENTDIRNTKKFCQHGEKQGEEQRI